MLTMEFGQSSLPMAFIMFSSLMWIVAPIIFCPQPTLATLSRDASELWSFVIAVPEWSVRQMKAERNKTVEDLLRVGLTDQRATLYEFWLKQALLAAESTTLHQLLNIVTQVVWLVLLLMIVFSSMLDNIHEFLFLFLLHFTLMDLWRILHRPTAFTLVILLMWIILPLTIFERTASVNLLTCFIVWVQALNLICETLQLVAWWVLRPNKNWVKMKESTPEEQAAKKAAEFKHRMYCSVVEYLYTNFTAYLI